MARDVMDCFLKIVEEEGQMTSGDAQVYMKKMEQQKRYQADVWSWFHFLTVNSGPIKQNFVVDWWIKCSPYKKSWNFA